MVWMGSVAVVFGVLFTFVGFSSTNPYGVMAGPMLVMIGVARGRGR